MASTQTKSAAVRARLDHPVIDADGHTLEFKPDFLDYLKQVGGAKVHDQFLAWSDRAGMARWYRMTWEERREWRMARPPFWGSPTRNTLDHATVTLPALQYERMGELGLDFSVVYPTMGLTFPHLPDEELRRACSRAHNTHQAEWFRPYADRFAPVAVIPMHTPREAIEELEFAVRELGMKAILMAGHVRRPLPGVMKKAPEVAHSAFWLDTFGLDSEYDYDPVWARCVELKVAPTFHSGAMGWGSRTSVTNYVYNHIGHFAEAGHAVCKSLFLGGVTRRFPTLKFAFLEGGAGWACNLFAALVEHWEKRNRASVENFNPANLDHELMTDLFRRYGRMPEEKIEQLKTALRKAAERCEDPAMLDEWAKCGIEREEDIRDLFVHNFYFCCEADDRMNALAFNAKMNPLGARFKALFSSDIGHWDVPDITGTVEEAYELVEEGLMTEEDFRDFVFANPVSLLAGTNPEFFKGTAIEKETAQLT